MLIFVDCVQMDVANRNEPDCNKQHERVPYEATKQTNKKNNNKKNEHHYEHVSVSVSICTYVLFFHMLVRIK
jgi:hypothetical protein